MKNICFTSLDLISSNTEDVSQTHAAMQEVSVVVNVTIMKTHTEVKLIKIYEFE